MPEPGEGTRITPSIRLRRILGRGGMGSVWVAEHEALGTEVAVKLIAPDMLRRDPSLVERFRSEARAAARIRSPHVVEIKDYGLTEDGTPFIVMERLEGESLADRLSRDSQLDVRTTAGVVAQVARALAAAHAEGIVHRDIKPDNIFLTRSSYELFVKVLDFGIAKIADESRQPDDPHGLTDTGTMVGTPEFMSPEQVKAEGTIDRRTDLWALGVVAYRCLTGKLPFSGRSMGAVCVAITTGQYVAPSALEPDLPPGLDEWMARALRVDRAGRFGDAMELADAFLQIAEIERRIAAPLDSSPCAVTPPLSALSPASQAAHRATPIGTDGHVDTGAATVAHTPLATVAPKPRRRAVPWLVGAGAVAVAAGVLVLANRGGHDQAEAGAPSPASATQVATTAPTDTASAPSATATAADTPSAAAPKASSTSRPALAPRREPPPVRSSKPPPAAPSGAVPFIVERR